MSKKHSIEELCDCGYEVENNTDWSDFDLGCEFVACPFYLDEGFGCTYFRWVAPEGTRWAMAILTKTKASGKIPVFPSWAIAINRVWRYLPYKCVPSIAIRGLQYLNPQ